MAGLEGRVTYNWVRKIKTLNLLFPSLCVLFVSSPNFLLPTSASYINAHMAVSEYVSFAHDRLIRETQI